MKLQNRFLQDGIVLKGEAARNNCTETDILAFVKQRRWYLLSRAKKICFVSFMMMVF